MSDPNQIPTEVDTKIDDLGNTDPIGLSGSINQNADDALHLTTKEEKDNKSTNDNSELENLSSNIGEGKDDEKVSPVSTEDKDLIFTDENEDSIEDPGKEHGIEISSSPHVEVTEKQNDALPKEADDEQTVVVSPLHELQEEENLTHEKEESLGLLKILSQQLNGGTAKLVEKDGQIQVSYSNSENQKFDVSQCGKIVAPKSNTKEVIENCLKVLDLIKETRAPDGVLLDRTKISCSRKGTYKSGEDYDVLDKILGKGLNGQIVVVRDKIKGSDHALKTVMLAYFDSNEIRCWTDLEGDDHFPSLYMFNKQNGNIEFHHEILDKAVTISDIIDNHMQKMRENHELLRHFSLYVLQGLLEASSVMHSKNWLHDDLHENNAMLQSKSSSELKVRVLDFGTAKKLDKVATIANDIHQIIRVFTSVYVTEKFKNAADLKKNWEVKLQEQAKQLQLSKENKDELLNIIKVALDVHLTEQEIELKKIVDCKLKDSSVENPNIMKEICKLIFPDHLETDTVDAGSPALNLNIFKIGK